eukprot:TRINITY_DN17029_c0_g1_i1.p1 TRINITY_DN17029_c0_g1~~TRINITY_DN17029_c0_g1_i1.p1  ORF type:complete len:155 (-),score=33.83 TRINITY_DN17029_c0_g1_i1:3-419(-)
MSGNETSSSSSPTDADGNLWCFAKDTIDSAGEGFLSMRKGQRLLVLDQDPSGAPGWWTVQPFDGDSKTVGLVPASYVELSDLNAIATMGHSSTELHHLSFESGAQFEVLEKGSNGFWRCRNTQTNEEGFVMEDLLKVK